MWVKLYTSAERKIYSNSQVLGHRHCLVKIAQGVDFIKLCSWALLREVMALSRRDLGRLQRGHGWLEMWSRGWLWELWSGCSRVVVGEVLVVGATRPPTSCLWELWSWCSRVVLGEVLVVGATRPPPSGFGSELVLTPFFANKCTYVLMFLNVLSKSQGNKYTNNIHALA